MTGFAGVRREMDGDRLTGSGEEFPAYGVDIEDRRIPQPNVSQFFPILNNRIT